MHLQESGEMYLETILVLSRRLNKVRSVDLYLTDEGRSVAEKTFERHRVLTKVFTKLGVSAGIAAEDACKIEHVISDETFEAIKRFVAEHSD